ncbi:TetR-like C-terminal domain-containing protein [Kitasatospora sp. NPDC056446]|uniref:TetR-like C-terminal domain-containing protein n=1 Tax=Kitasatospora sp. NPDC056446 TaxID=3345819 RepID=UPI0036A14E2C
MFEQPSAGFRPGDAREVSGLFWAATHGAVSLELAGHFAPADAGPRYEALMAALGRAFGADAPPADSRTIDRTVDRMTGPVDR